MLLQMAYGIAVYEYKFIPQMENIDSSLTEKNANEWVGTKLVSWILFTYFPVELPQVAHKYREI